MALKVIKVKIVASSSSATAAEPQMGGVPPQEAPNSGKMSSNGFRHWEHEEALSSNFSLKFQKLVLKLISRCGSYWSAFDL